MARRLKLDDEPELGDTTPERGLQPGAKMQASWAPGMTLGHEQIAEAATAAVATLARLGFTWEGGQEWKPPLGPSPFAVAFAWMVVEMLQAGPNEFATMGVYAHEPDAVRAANSLIAQHPERTYAIRPMYFRNGDPVRPAEPPRREADQIVERQLSTPIFPGRPENWTCPTCHSVNNELRSRCRHCRNPRP